MTDNTQLAAELAAFWPKLAEYSQSDFADAAAGEYGEDLLNGIVGLLSRSQDALTKPAVPDVREAWTNPAPDAAAPVMTTGHSTIVSSAALTQSPTCCEATREALGHDAAIGALVDCATSTATLSYQEAIEGYFKLRGIKIP